MPVAIEISIDLLALAALIVLIGLSKALRYTLVSFLQWIARGLRATHIPGTGWVAGHIEEGSHWLYNQIGVGILVFEHAASWFFHNLAVLAKVLGDSIKGLAYDLLWLYHHVEKFTVPYWIGRVQKWVLQQITAFARHPIRYLKHAIAEVRHLGHDVVRLIRQAEAAALHAASVAGHAIAHPFPLAPPWIGKRIGELERKIDRELSGKFTWLEKLAISALAGAVVLRILGKVAPWIRCTNVRRVGNRLCHTPVHFLDDLLALTADFFVLTSICRVIPWLETAFADVAAPLIERLGRAGAGLCGAGYTRPDHLAVPTLHLPDAVPVQLYLP